MGDFKWGIIEMECRSRREEEVEERGFTKLELLPLVETGAMPGRRVIAGAKKF